MNNIDNIEKLQEHNVLFFMRTMESGGTEKVALQLCEVLQPIVNKIVVCSCGGVYVKKLEEMGIVHYQIPDIEVKNPNIIFDVMSSVKRIIKKESITIIHTHHRMAAFYVSLLGLYKKQIFLNTSHCIFENKKMLTQFAYKNAKIAACGDMVKNNLLNYFKIPADQITTIHNSVRKNDCDVVEDMLLSRYREEGYFLVGNICRLVDGKGLEDFIYAASLVKEKQNKIRFMIVGSGEREEEYKQLVKDLKLSDDVLFLGYRSDVQSVMKQLDLVVSSSYFEGFPLVPIEAFSVGKTIVATAVGGTTEIVRNYENGLLVEPKNPYELSEKMCEILKDKNLRRFLEENALRDFAENFSFEIFAKKYIQFYLQALNKH